ncbi:cytochrome C oxidase subunit II [Burkholderia sp. Ac-20365]|uniref:cytochrome C oxidase subunit II n=1 Tax=Burkholderia sp. Ac-20365 TaxID=2703897 RepID=UPI00197C2262|nr:cytochrome C oxidase subunit II [Burkholderia sp. Ac-20365]MBN3759267.1 cytochrome C oxidase subunit II [Burkholderia sp. Ac-20365]
MSDDTKNDLAIDVVHKIERKWAILMSSLIVILVLTVVFTGLHWAMMPPSRVETVLVASLGTGSEFVESNLGSAQSNDGSVTVRILAQQYSFTPQCILIPANTPITFRATSADVIHGMLVTGTNINSMVEPGYISTFKTVFPRPAEHLMPCHEYCGTGHQAMWAHVKIIDRASFFEMLKRKGVNGRLDCVN